MKMNHLFGGRCACGSVFVVIALTGCISSEAQPPTQQTAQQTETPPEISPKSDAHGEPVLLRTALLPPDTPQSVFIKLHEQRETTGESFPKTVYSLDLELHASLVSKSKNDDGEIKATLTFQRIVMKYGLVGRASHQFAYDSATDKPNSGNPLADLMQYMPSAVYELRVGPSGRLRSLDCPNLKWGLGNPLLAPPALLTAQWTFRDESMQAIVSEALFPPMPAGPVREGDAWDVIVPANIPLVARIDSRLHSKLTRIDRSQDDHPIATISAVGKLSPAPDLIAGQPPAIYPIIQSGQHTVTQTVNPATGTLVQHQQVELVADIVMKAPADDTSLTMTIKRKRTIDSKRGPETPRTVMKDSKNPSS